MKLHFVDLPKDLFDALAELADILKIELSDEGFAVRTFSCEKGLSVNFEGDSAAIGYEQRVHFFRAVGLLVEHFEDRESVTEIPRYKELSVMYDTSRNQLPTVESHKQRIRHLALMGYTSMLLNLEDTFEIEGYPYFGYMRGRYTHEELRAIDDYAYQYGIEVVPCIQVLAHLDQALRWLAFRPIWDCDNILLVDEPKTYDFIAAMLDACIDSFRTKRIHIGMDEAWNLGNGNYFRRHGYRDQTEILKSHLTKVMELIRARDLQPIMWSDMFFSTAFNRHDYYYAATLEDPHLPQSTLDIVPEDMELVYWDYGNSYKVYNIMCKLHNEFRNPIWFCGGATIWAGYAPMNQFSIRTSRDALRACHENGIDKILVAAWGNNGAECPLMTAFPTLQMYAEDCYEDDNSDEFVAKRFKICIDADYQDFLMLDTPNFTPRNPAPGCGSRNPSKYFLHQDVLMGLFDKHQTEDFPAHFADRDVALREAGERNPRWKYLFDTMAELCHVLVVKTDVGVRLKKAYDAGDRDTLCEIAAVTIPEIQRRVDVFMKTFQKQWMTDNKVFGLDVIEIRIGALEKRLKVAIDRIQAYLDGQVDSLPELEQERLYFDGDNDPNRNPNRNGGRWGEMISGCAINNV